MPTGMLEETKEEFRRYLRNHGLRLTPERVELLRTVLTSPAHFDADELVSRMRRRERRVSRATIYRTLALLEQSGILRRSLLGQGRSLYETMVGRGHHDHLVCISCGRIEEFYEEQIEQVHLRIARSSGFRLLDHIHELFGLCRDCQGRAATEGERHQS